ncbi:MAG: EamA family transporter [Actinomyces sp.]|nr:EamA family transporter [Actinomyces sp.]
MRHPMGYAVTVVAALCWGASGVSAEYLMSRHGIELTLISFLRMSIGGLLTLACVLLRSRGVSAQHRDLVCAPRNWRDLAIYAVFGLAACQITYMGVIRASNAGTGTILEYLGLILIVVWVCLTHRRWPRACETIAIVLAVSGTFLLCTHGSLDSLVITPSALAWGAVAALTLATYTLLPARLIAAYGADVVVGYALLIAGLGVGLVGRVWRFAITWTPDVILAMVITVVLGTTVAFTAYLWGVDRIGPVKASLIGSLEPIAAAALSALVMGTSYTGVDIVGMILIVGAVVTISVVDLLRARRVT